MGNKSLSLYFLVLALVYPVYIAFIGHGIDMTNTAIEIGFIAVAGFYYLRSRDV